MGEGTTSPLRRRAAAEQHRPGYLVVEAGDEGTYVGGLMVTDDSGLPLDFRYTDPITPSRLQRALYGGALDRYLRSDVVAATLLKAVEERPSLLLVEDETLLDAPGASCPIALVAPSRVPAIGPPGATREEAPERVLVQVAEGESPVRVSVPDAQDRAAVTGALAALCERMDPREPADRVRAALVLIAAGETV